MSTVEQFKKLREMSVKLHMHTYCIKKQDVIFTRNLKPIECINCKEYILNKGICDPL